MEKMMIQTPTPYPIIWENGLINRIGDLLNQEIYGQATPGEEGQRKAVILTDDHVGALYLKPLTASLEKAGFFPLSMTIAPGEGSKSLSGVEKILDFLVKHRITGKDLLISLGGGIVGDLTGFVASIYHRGCDYVQIPSSLLAMVDASIGGKTAVNLKGGKNLAGAFWQPRAVFLDPELLATLPQQERRNGMAEVVKSAIIADPNLFEAMEKEPLCWKEAIPLSWIIAAITVKKNLVEKDERDSGPRQLLNLGHTIGHSLEHLSGFAQPHGYCVAQGMVAIAKLAYQAGWINENPEPRIAHLLFEMGFDLDWPYSIEEIFHSLTRDKKTLGETITLILPHSIGHCQRYSLSLSLLKTKMEEVFS